MDNRPNLYEIEVAEEPTNDRSDDDQSTELEHFLNVADPIIIKADGNITLFGLGCKFNTEFPSSLIGRIAPEEFASTVHHINQILNKTVAVNFKWFLLGCLCCCCTAGCSIWPSVCLNKRSKHCIRKALDHENKQLYHKLGLHWSLAKRKCQSDNMCEYVLAIEIIPKLPVYRPD